MRKKSDFAGLRRASSVMPGIVDRIFTLGKLDHPQG